MKNSLMFLATIFFLVSCAKEEFAGNKGVAGGNVSPIITTSTKLCSQSTLVSPQVDILMLWDNSSSFNVITDSTRASMGQLITNISENFDYHVLSLPLVATNLSSIASGVLVAKNAVGLTASATSILKTKEQAVASLNFSSVSAVERGADRALEVIKNNRSNGIFRDGAYTIVVVISNEDDEGCGFDNGSGSCTLNQRMAHVAPRIKQLLCLRGNSQYSASACSAVGINSSLDSSIMRFMNISPLTICERSSRVNNIYREVARGVYSEPYTNGWPTSSDDFSSNPDSYNLCTVNPANVFDGVTAVIKQTLIKHVYEYWPVAGADENFDPDSIRVVKSNGKILGNRANDSSISNGYELLVDTNGQPETQINRNTRTFPTPGEPFTGKMIRLFGVNGNDKIVYPDCLTVTFDEVKKQYGYVYISNSAPNVATIELRINGNLIPKDSTNGWDYMGLQSTSGLDQDKKVALLPAGGTSGYIIRLNGNAEFKNTGAAINVQVFFNSAGQ